MFVYCSSVCSLTIRSRGVHVHSRCMRALKAGGRGFESDPSSLFSMKIEKRAHVCMRALKAGGLEFESDPSSLFSMKIEKRARRFVALFAFEV